MARDALREEERESRWEAAPAVGVVVGLQVLLAAVSRTEDWTTWRFHWWVWLIPVAPEAVLLLLLWWKRPHRRLQQMGIRREVSITLLAIVSLANALLVVAVIASLIEGQEKSGAQLLLKASTVWATNVIAFGLWYWAVDRGGPVRRLRGEPPPPDFQFPQMENPELVPPGWQPELVDYLYVSFTNSIAFSPTDAMPLSRRAKLLMLSESAISAVTILLVAARAVNIFK
jgi:cytochrome bd-type quinol oxidase subunit 2